MKESRPLEKMKENKGKEEWPVKTCIACGMPMTKKEDFAMGDEGKDYCLYCMREDGAMQTYPEKLKGTTSFLMKTQGFDETAARDMAIRLMRKLPAWKDIRDA